MSGDLARKLGAVVAPINPDYQIPEVKCWLEILVLDENGDMYVWKMQPGVRWQL